MGGTTEEFSFDQKRNLAGRRRNRGRHLRSGISGFVIGDHCSFGRRATTDFQRCGRSEEHTSELQSLMRISYAVFCLKKKQKHYNTHITTSTNHSSLQYTLPTSKPC